MKPDHTQMQGRRNREQGVMVDKLLPYLNRGADYSNHISASPRIFRPSYGPEKYNMTAAIVHFAGDF